MTWKDISCVLTRTIFGLCLYPIKWKSYMYKFTVTENEPPKMYRYVGNEPIDLSTFYELTDINQFSELIITIYQFVHLF